MTMHKSPAELVVVLDFGAQYSQLITRKIRELGVYSEIMPYNTTVDELRRLAPSGIVLSGGPESAYAEDAPMPDRDLFALGVPILGICYGLQVAALCHDGKVTAVTKKEFGLAELTIDDRADLFKGIEQNSKVWMSHGDTLTTLPPDFEAIAHTDNSPFAAVANRKKDLYCVQFHPEVTHTVDGQAILGNFLFEICQCKGQWSPDSFVKRTVDEVRQKVGSGKVICALSGGVDSVVAAALVFKAIGNQLTCVFVDNGLMRKNEAREVEETFRSTFDSNFIAVDAVDTFLTRLKGVSDPEQKRKLIGRTFIEVFESEADKIPDVQFLVQGTLYPDVIESVSTQGPSATIKTHHNVGGLPETMNLKLIEPLRELFKDEVRKVGRQLGIPDVVLGRHPFPGPGLAVRVLGDITPDRLLLLREVDAIFIGELRATGWYDRIWQAFAVLLPVKSVGVMGDRRTYENVVGLRAVGSSDGMTADWIHIPHEILGQVSNRIINEVRGVNRVVYDISSKPPSTIEWE